MPEKRIYFISDLHLGLYPSHNSRQREKMVVDWLDNIKKDACEIFLLGDIFDFWYEYKRVVPRGYIRFLGKLAELSDSGIKINFFTGNHDIWTYDYLSDELGMTVYKNHIETEIDGYKFYIGHGDGLGPGDNGYKLMKAIFHNRILQWLFSRLHPNFAMWLGYKWSKHSRYAKGLEAQPIENDANESQIIFACNKLKEEHFDYFIFGHRHIPFDIELANNSRIINLGDWITHFTYGVFDGKNFELLPAFPDMPDKIIKRKSTLFPCK